MNKSKILNKRFFDLYEQEDIELCMQEFADQEMITFVDWVALRYQCYTYTLWIDIPTGKEILNSAQLLQKYKEEREK